MFTVTNLILWVHVGFGSLAVIAGATALAGRKGAVIHVRSGRVFAIAMIVSSITGAILGLLRFETVYITFHAGILAITLIASGLLTVRNLSANSGALSSSINALNLLNFGALVFLGTYALKQSNGQFFSFPAEDYFFLAALCGLAAVFDVSLLFRKTVSNSHRIARHLWRMCIGFFIAAGSAFTGPGSNAFPEIVRQSGLLAAPELIIISLMLFWLFRTLAWVPRRRRG